MMFLNLSKVSGNYTPHAQDIFSQQFSPVTGETTMMFQ